MPFSTRLDHSFLFHFLVLVWNIHTQVDINYLYSIIEKLGEIIYILIHTMLPYPKSEFMNEYKRLLNFHL